MTAPPSELKSAEEHCRMFCAWKGGGPCLADDCPRKVARTAPPSELFDRARFEQAPCYLCGYNGAGYYQPDTHRCAARYHGYDAPADSELRGWGYAAGNYTVRCVECDEMVDGMDKRAIRCRPCARKRHENVARTANPTDGSRVEVLRDHVDAITGKSYIWGTLVRQAADEIERLKQSETALRAELAEAKQEASSNEMCMLAVLEIRKACKEIMGGNCSFVDDDFARCLLTLRDERDALRADAELALWALRGNVCWLGTSIQRGPFEFVAIRLPRPYASPEIMEGTFHADPWECLRLARAQEQLSEGPSNG